MHTTAGCQPLYVAAIDYAVAVVTETHLPITVIFVNENENGQKGKNNKFVNEN